jgi:signal transduction histidine kinase
MTAGERKLVPAADLERRLAMSKAREAALVDALAVMSRAPTDLEGVLHVVLDRAAGICGAERASIHLLDGDTYRTAAFWGPSNPQYEALAYGTLRSPGRDTLIGRVALERAVVHIADVLTDAEYRASELQRLGGYRTMLGIPLLREDVVIGVFVMTRNVVKPFAEGEIGLVRGFADQAAVAIENARLHERARQAAVLEERERLARELHDSVTQSLYAVSLHAEAAARALADGETAPVGENLGEIRATVHEALGEMRLLLFELRPPPLEEHGLVGALQTRLRAVEARSGLAAEFQGDEGLRLRPETERELYRVAQEALNNVLKHAHASRVTVRLDAVDGHAALEVADDGVGFEPALRGGGGFGLPGMRERVERLGGSLRIESALGTGTRVRAEVPR